MAKLELIFISLVLLMAILEFFIPLIQNKPLFPSFRSTEIQGIEDKIDTAKKKVSEVKEVQKEVDEKVKEIQKIKDDSDGLLK